MRKKLLALLCILMVVFSVLLTGCGANDEVSQDESGNISNDEVYNWKLVSCWTEGSFLFEVDKRFCELVGELSDGQLNIKPYGVGKIGPANQVFDLVKNGTVEAGGDWPSYWTGKNTGFDLLATNIFGFSNWDFYIWIYEAGGLEDAYNYMFNKSNMVYFPTAITGMESGIRSNVPINSLEDMKGMKIRLAGKIQGKVAEEFGVTPVTIASNELYEALQRGVIDAAEFSVPHNDDVMKLQEVTQYWLTPGWHQTASVYGIMINQDAYNGLPEHLKNIIDAAAKTTGHEYTAKYAWNDAVACQKILDSGIKTTRLPDEEMKIIEEVKTKVLEEMAAENPDYAHILKSQINYLKKYASYRDAQGEWGFGNNWNIYPDIE
ncbi:MAG: TRAP transporter substrate-binding protein DctP [Clostridia bacterium]|nr:TRAP transporter substrate-binding protein DctP [Clostridia bacterium]